MGYEQRRRCRTCGTKYSRAPRWIDFGRDTQRVCPDNFHTAPKFPEWHSGSWIKPCGVKWTSLAHPDGPILGTSFDKSFENRLIDAIEHFLDHIEQSLPNHGLIPKPSLKEIRYAPRPYWIGHSWF